MNKKVRPPKLPHERNWDRFVIGILILLGLALLAIVASHVSASPNDQPEFPTAQYLGEGPRSIVMTAQKNYVFKPKGSWKFDLVTGTDQTYELPEGARMWETTATSAPMTIYQQTLELGWVEIGCVVEFLVLDDDVDDRKNVFKLNGDEIHMTEQGMATRGNFVVMSDGNLTFTASDSVAVWTGICEKKITPTPEPSPTATATTKPTATPTTTNTPSPTGTPEPQHGLFYIPLVTWSQPPPTETPTPIPTLTPAPASWIFVGTYADPHWWSQIFASDTVPYWQGVPDETWQTHWDTGRQYALISQGKVIEFDICEYEQNVDVICAIFVNSKEVKTDLFEVIEVDLGEVFLFVGEDYCLGGPCLHVQTWWKQDLQAHGLLVDLFAEIQRAKVATQ